MYFSIASPLVRPFAHCHYQCAVKSSFRINILCSGKSSFTRDTTGFRPGSGSSLPKPWNSQGLYTHACCIGKVRRK